MGQGQQQGTVHLIDFGLAKMYRSQQTGKHIPYRDNKDFTGTMRFASLNTHLGIEQSRRDDLESLGYLLVYLVRGDLPWQGMHSDQRGSRIDKVFKCKVSHSVERLCFGLPCMGTERRFRPVREVHPIFEGAEV